MRLSTTRASLALAVLVLCSQNKAVAATVGFDSFPDSTLLTNQIPGLAFSNTIILTSGITLNEFEFPPHSGTNVASDNGGPITITFSPAVISFSGYFTYAVPLTLRAFDGSNAQVATTTSHFSNNEALSGAAGSSPNELLQVSSAGGIARITITGDPAGSSFTMDDIAYPTPTSSIPLLSPLALIFLVLLLGALGSVLVKKGPRVTARSALAALCLLLVLVGVLSIEAQEQTASQQPMQFQALAVSHSRIPANQPTDVTVSIQSIGSGVIPGSLNLLRLKPDGTPVPVQPLSQTPGSSNGSRGYNGHLLVTGKSGEQIRFLVSISNRGTLRRNFSKPITINVVSPK